MDSYRVVFEGFESAGVSEEIRSKLSAKGLRAVIQSDSEAPEGFKLSPEVASIIVSGIGALPVVLSSLLLFASNRKTGRIVIVGQTGRKIEIPKDTPPQLLPEYIEAAKQLDEVRQITVSSR